MNVRANFVNSKTETMYETILSVEGGEKKSSGRAVPKKGNCCICYEMKVDSLLYRYFLAFEAKTSPHNIFELFISKLVLVKLSHYVGHVHLQMARISGSKLSRFYYFEVILTRFNVYKHTSFLGVRKMDIHHKQ